MHIEELTNNCFKFKFVNMIFWRYCEALISLSRIKGCDVDIYTMILEEDQENAYLAILGSNKKGKTDLNSNYVGDDSSQSTSLFSKELPHYS